ncbi:MAG: hypothetical protein AAF705_05690, partial [Bacteroidota bacterium]
MKKHLQTNILVARSQVMGRPSKNFRSRIYLLFSLLVLGNLALAQTTTIASALDAEYCAEETISVSFDALGFTMPMPAGMVDYTLVMSGPGGPYNLGTLNDVSTDETSGTFFNVSFPPAVTGVGFSLSVSRTGGGTFNPSALFNITTSNITSPLPFPGVICPGDVIDFDFE